MRAILRRELLLSWRHGSDTLGAVLLFVVTASLFPLAVGPGPELLGRMAPGVVWVCALLATLLPLDRIHAADAEDGTLDQLLVAGVSPYGIALAKAVAHWLVTGLPLMVAAVPVSAILNMEFAATLPLLTGLAMGTLVLSLVGTAGAAVVLGSRIGGLLLPLLVVPLCIPVLIFGTGATEPGAARPNLLLLGALLCAALPLCPIAAGAGLRAAADA